MRNERSACNAGKNIGTGVITMAKQNLTIPTAPSYLPDSMAARFNTIAPILTKAGALGSYDADLLAKYILAENEYLRVTNNVTEALNKNNAEAANKWLNAQDRLARQCLLLASELGLTPNARREAGIVLPEVI